MMLEAGVTDARRPLHLAVMIGASTALYAVSMAGVTAIQSNNDRTLIMRQTPAEDAAARLHAGHDQLEAQINQAADAYGRAAGGYDALTPRLGDMEDSLGNLAGRVQTVSGAAQALPGRISLPPISRSVVRTVTTSKPATSTTTGASGK
jgi:hypothetical protein